MTPENVQASSLGGTEMGQRRETHPRPHHSYAKAIPGLAIHRLRDFGRGFSPIWALVSLISKMSNLDQVMSEDPRRTSFSGLIVIGSALWPAQPESPRGPKDCAVWVYGLLLGCHHQR